MPLLKDDQHLRDQVKARMLTAISEMDRVDSKQAFELAKWMLEKAKYFRQHYERQKPQKLPRTIGRGDIIRVEFGINIGHEFSDMFTDKHFALVWAQQGLVFLVIPLTKQPQREDNKFVINLGKISGMPTDQDTYARLDSIRSISIRRIKRLHEHPDGKLTITDPSVLERIKAGILENFIDSTLKGVDSVTTS